MVTNYGSFQCRVELPNAGEKHRTRKAKDVLAEYDTFSSEFLDALRIQSFIPMDEKDGSTVYRLRGTVVYGDSDE